MDRMSIPSIVTSEPGDGSTRRKSAVVRLDLPAPVLPTMPTRVRGATSNDMPRITGASVLGYLWAGGRGGGGGGQTTKQTQYHSSKQESRAHDVNMKRKSSGIHTGQLFDMIPATAVQQCHNMLSFVTPQQRANNQKRGNNEINNRLKKKKKTNDANIMTA